MIIPPRMASGELGVTCIDMLPHTDCVKIIDMHTDNANPRCDARVGSDGDNVVDLNTRHVEQWIVADTPENKWLDTKLCGLARKANEDFFHFDICGLIERPLLLKYTAPSGHYQWHTDLGNGDASNRKISIVIPLSRLGDYEGGELCFFSTGETEHAIDAGEVICFPSFIPHRVKPVTRNHRWSLVAWISGSSFR